MNTDRAERAVTDVVAVERLAPLYRNRQWLKIQLNKGLKHAEIAALCDVTRHTITKWASKHNLNRYNIENTEQYHEREWLWEMYHERGMTIEEIADSVGVEKSTISMQMSRNNIEVNSSTEWNERVEATYTMTPNGYFRWESSYNGEMDTVRVNRLLAVSEYGFDAVCDMDVHHKNEIKWDNRPENIELMTHAEHTAHHNKGGN